MITNENLTFNFYDHHKWSKIWLNVSYYMWCLWHISLHIQCKDLHSNPSHLEGMCPKIRLRNREVMWLKELLEFGALISVWRGAIVNVCLSVDVVSCSSSQITNSFLFELECYKRSYELEWKQHPLEYGVLRCLIEIRLYNGEERTGCEITMIGMSYHFRLLNRWRWYSISIYWIWYSIICPTLGTRLYM